MDALTIATLVLRYGIPFVSGLIEKAHKKETVSTEEWAGLLLKVETPFDSLVPKAAPPPLG